MAKKFFYVCAGLFLLALSYHLGARNAGANGGMPVTPLGIDQSNYIHVMAANGDIYTTPTAGTSLGGPAQLIGNFWGGKPTPTTTETWGQLKQRYR